MVGANVGALTWVGAGVGALVAVAVVGATVSSRHAQGIAPSGIPVNRQLAA